MDDLQSLRLLTGAVFATAIVVGVVTWLIVSRRLRASIDGYASIKEAVRETEEGLAQLRVDSDEASSLLARRERELHEVEGRTRELRQLESRASEIRDLIDNGQARRDDLEGQIEERDALAKEKEAELRRLQSDLDLYSRIEEFVAYGIFEQPEYLHEASERYQIEIKRVREEQANLIRDKRAVEIPADVQIEGSSKKGSAVLDGQAKMMLRAFNIECDLLMGKLNPSNFDRTLERIERNAAALEKTTASLMCGISTDYVTLKFEECRLFYEYKLKKADEQEEQRAIREQIREEQKAIREYEKAIADAEREERMYEASLERARAELAAANESEKAGMATRVAMLEQQLQEAHAKEDRAKSLAEQTRRGHVYIISNIGSFGENIYKIGLTRRLDPMDRVKELGDASVPFRFDVHAVIFSEDAPALEAELHRRFSQRRVNAVNLRKEFFAVSLTEIRSAVNEISGSEAEFTMTAVAEEYYETLRLQGAVLSAA